MTTITNSDAVKAANLKAGYSPTDTSSEASATSDYTFFLKMLTTQLQNQDPTAPMDVTQMTAQIAQYSTVEQQVQTNTNLKALIASNKQSELSTAVSYIGKEIETTGKTGEVIGGQGAFSYILPQAANAVQLTIKDASGNIVFTGEGTKDSGRNIVVWDGKNSSTGEQEADGTYTLSVTATDSANKAITPELRGVGIVRGIENDSDGNVILNMGDVQVKYDTILAVRSPSRIATTGAES